MSGDLVMLSAPSGSGYFLLRWALTATAFHLTGDHYRLLGPDHDAALGIIARAILAASPSSRAWIVPGLPGAWSLPRAHLGAALPLLALTLAGPFYWAVGPLRESTPETDAACARIRAGLDPGPADWLVPAPEVSLVWARLVRKLGRPRAVRAPAPVRAPRRGRTRSPHEPER